MYTDKINDQIFRILVPLGTLNTTIYIYKCEEGVAIIDSATYSTDIDEYVIPALEEMNISHEDIKYLLLTHDHFDHAGGIQRLSELFPSVVLGTSFPIDLPNRIELVDGQKVLGNLQGICLPGHTASSFGFYDTATQTLLSGDCLQLAGVGKYRDGIEYFDDYIQSVNRLKSMDIQRIVAAHEYDPLGSMAEGKQAVIDYLDKCIEIAEDKK